MKRLLSIVILVLIGAFSYFAYTVVATSKLADRDKSIQDLQSRLDYSIKSAEQQKKAFAAEKERIHDAMVILLPKQKEVIDNAFSPPAPATQPTTAPSTQPAK